MRSSDADRALLVGIADRVAALDQARAELAEVVRSANRAGVSWARIASALGISRQAAWERYNKKSKTAHRFR